MTRRTLAALAAATMIAIAMPTTAALAADPPPTWDELVLVKSKRFDYVYLLPDADFRPYTKVMLDPAEVAFRKNWLRDYNSSSPGRRISEADAQKKMDEIRAGFGEVFKKAYEKAGYTVVETPGPDVLRLRTAVVNIDVNAPDVPVAGRVHSFSEEAGQATVIVEARDSTTGAVLGRAVDRKLAGDTSRMMRNSLTNRSDFERMFQAWAKSSIDGLAELKARSPLDTALSGSTR